MNEAQPTTSCPPKAIKRAFSEHACSHAPRATVKISDRVHSQVDKRPEPFASWHAAQVRAVASAFLRIRPWLIGPMLLPVAFLLWRAEVPHTQLYALPSLMALMLCVFVFDAIRASRSDLSETAVIVSMFVTGLGLTGVCALSGGLRSPLLPLLLAPTVTLFAAFGRSIVSIGSVLILVAALGVIGLLFPSASFPLLPNQVAIVVGAAALLLTTALLYVSVAGLTRAYEDLGGARDSLQHDLLTSAQERMHSIELLSAKLAHELRNPLQAVKGLVELEARSASGKSHDRLVVVRQEIRRLESIADSYLRFSRPIRPADRLESDVLALVLASLDAMEARAAQKGIALRALGESTTATLDPGTIQMALCNLLSNAIDASESGDEVRVTVASTPDSTTLCVADDGTGMSEERLQRAGTPFETGTPGGTGLGLAITRQIAEAHGGSLAIASTLGAGTIATLSLPRNPWPAS